MTTTRNQENYAMDNNTSTAVQDEASTLASDAQALIEATANVAGDQVAEARKRLSAALDHGRRLLTKVKDRTVAGAKATDAAVHANPYLAIGIALSVGALIGFLVAGRRSRSRD